MLPHPMLQVRAFCAHLLRSRWACKLLAGHGINDDGWREKFLSFWARYREVDPNHPAYRDHESSLATCIPVLLHGDEGTGHRRKPVMQLSFGPVLAIGGGALERLFLLTTCPGKLYAQYNMGVEAGNQVIDRLLEEVGRSMRTAYFVGVATPVAHFYVVCVGVSGDHVFQTKAFRCRRHHTRNDLCPHCLANTRDIPFEDLGANALWTQTVFRSTPWNRPPPLRFIPGADRPQFIQFDLMHVLPHGCGRNFIASVICMMAGPLQLFLPGNGSRSRQACLEEAYSSFESFCVANMLYPRDMKDFTLENLQWSLKRDFPDCNCKAMDCNMMFQWCIDYLSSSPLLLTEPLALAYAGCCGFDNFNRLCYRSTDRVFWNRAEAEEGHGHLLRFLKSYRALAYHWNKEGWTLFNLTPKYHYAAHWLHSLRTFLCSDQTWCLNPGCFATPLMEDFIGVTSRISRTTHPSAVPKATLLKYLVEVRRAWCRKAEAYDDG